MSYLSVTLERIRWRFRRFILARPMPAGQAPEPLAVAGLFRSASGIGESVRRCAAALRRQGLDPVCIDLTEALGQTSDLPPYPESAPLPLDMTGTLLLHVNGPETARALFKLGMLRPRAWRTIGYWAWELPVGPRSWTGASRYLTEVWTPSRFVTDAVRPICQVPVRTVPHFVVAPIDPAAKSRPDGLQLPDNALVVFVIADGRSSLRRKNVEGAVRAFCKAFPVRSDVRLVIKCRNLDEFPEEQERLGDEIGGDPRIELIDRTVSRAEMDWLQNRCDILLSMHRSEGFGLHLAECMALGKPVIATGWSGNLDFMSDDVAALLPYRLMPVDAQLPVYRGFSDAEWADPDIEAAVTHLRRLAEDRDERNALGARARAAIQRHLDGRAWADALSAGAVEGLGSRGEDAD